MSVQFSLSGGRTAALNIINAIKQKELIKYKPLDPGYVIPLGPGHALSVLFGYELHGRIPFFLHYFMSIYRTWGFKNKICIMKDLFKELMPWPSDVERHRRIDSIHEHYCTKVPEK
jgi:NADH dehydrogenase FAD-containing subunit